MANIKSQIKRNRQNEKRHERNKAVRSELKTRVKRALTAAEQGADDAADAARAADRRLDKAAAKGVIHKNAAARRKSRLHKRLAKIGRLAASRDARPFRSAGEPAEVGQPRHQHFHHQLVGDLARVRPLAPKISIGLGEQGERLDDPVVAQPARLVERLLRRERRAPHAEHAPPRRSDLERRPLRAPASGCSGRSTNP